MILMAKVNCKLSWQTCKKSWLAWKTTYLRKWAFYRRLRRSTNMSYPAWSNRLRTNSNSSMKIKLNCCSRLRRLDTNKSQLKRRICFSKVRGSKDWNWVMSWKNKNSIMIFKSIRQNIMNCILNLVWPKVKDWGSLKKCTFLLYLQYKHNLN